MNPYLQDILHNITTRLAKLEEAQPKKEWGGVMTDKQPEALRLADEADHRDFGLDPEPTWIKNAAAELRRLHEENETLRSKLIEPKLEQENDMKKYFASPNPWKLMP